ncbi:MULTISPECIES: 5-(carboxyamino)imidazole ribonucleotide synthase [Mycobacterium avium complex (MAC)]|uniref:N5-carboxyaminoimidazole ribonucleotide synthase n=4 Tax=Mycobacterium avium complex (MAC) TaxID=120793 RepID=A0AAW5RZM1_MYCBC|nr:phosphoribosylaminoimidazole carboxylase [Mycobacterium avium 05-4293]ETB15259.1 phosphoribosylaminoimidazole carboxylase [Mycobacterium avium subsp. silvaticum ATCC 49884]ETB24036.1 phosphoribosylaminoimidazole carboxylase [Mycobacterium avium subsp. avium 11-4751]ETB32635.1 phosphoribosylaminoimidazole carboxylase [Mycobacterium avium subsp. hominissuis 10-4249]KBR61105.1 N5-carboxyaminoimidazole ribonucleotide synthase [Mycobacterium avium XTB13-223]MBZ4501557.1 5-(carboxyamino)imidazole
MMAVPSTRPPGAASAKAAPRAVPRAVPVVAMVGGGQLARMTHQAAIALGQSLRVLATAADESAALVASDVVIGSHTDLEDLRRVAAGADVLTFDHEHVPGELLDKLVAEGVNVAPPPQALVHAQDKLVMRRRLESLGVPVPRYAEINSLDELDAFARRVGGPVVVKAVRGGYDGRGVRMARDPVHAREIAAAFLADGVPVLAEEQVSLRRELSALVARSPFGQGAAWPVVETVQRDGICVQVIAPAPGLGEDLAADAQRLALRLAGELGVVGVLAVELFETTDGALLVNELAMRPHNSGHWTMDGSRTGQFEQHLRAVLDYPLGDTDALAPVTVMANVLGARERPRMSVDERLHHLFARMPDARVHLYGKAERPGRKVGHINFLGDFPAADTAGLAALRRRAELAAHWLSHGQWTDGWDPHEQERHQ